MKLTPVCSNGRQIEVACLLSPTEAFAACIPHNRIMLRLVLAVKRSEAIRRVRRLQTLNHPA
jgi:hypothetical protein